METTTIKQSLVDTYASDLKSEAMALQLQPFRFRNRKMGQLVGTQTSVLLAMSLEKNNSVEKLSETITKACIECGFMFDKTKPDYDYKKAKSATGEIALKYIPKALEDLQIQVDLNSLIETVDIIDVVKQLSDEFGVKVRDDLKVDDIIPVLNDVVPEDDHFRDEIKNLRGHGNNLTSDQVDALLVAETITAAEYIGNQMHVAIEEGNNNRLNRLQFNPYPKVKELKLKEIEDKGFSKLDALYGLSFEVWKDVKMLKDALRAKMAS